jgi:hypothetical protein
MTKHLQRPIFRPLIAFLIVMLAAISQPREAQARSGCKSFCFDYCPVNPWSLCNAVGGGTCGLGASCNSGYTSGCLFVRIDCVGGAEQ